MSFYKKKNRIWLWPAVFTVFIFLHFSGAISILENFLISSVDPLSSFFYRNGSKFRKSYEKNKEQQDIYESYNNLEQEISSLIVKNANYKELELENEKLRSFLSFLSNNKHKNILANVISRDSLFNIQEGDQNIVIDKGINDGAVEGLGVINENGILVGRIVEARDHVSKICLTTNRNCKFAATIQNKDRTMGITEGDLGLTIKMNFIPQSDSISTNDIIISSGLGGSIPRGLVIGRVSQINNSSNEIWQDVNIEPIINLNTLTIVSILIP